MSTGKIIYHAGSLFKAPSENTILIHACNCKGKWGSGIAKQFAERYPESHKDYKRLCKTHESELLGMGIIFQKPEYQSVGYLFTSFDYGENVDPPKEILRNTKTALTCIFQHLPEGMEVHAPKINSGLFRVPWQHTEAIIERLLAHYNVPFHVWEGE